MVKNYNTSLSVIGLKESSNSFFLPHYYTLQKLHKDTRIVHVESRSVMYTRSGLENMDFWNMDADFMYSEDMLSFNDMLTYSGNYFDYFSEFMRVYRVAHSLFEREDMLKNDWNKNKSHIMDIYMNMVSSDLVWVSPVLKEIFDRILKNVFSRKMLAEFERKFIVLPPPDLYKVEKTEEKKSFKQLVFLWNHRFNEVKNPKLFFSIIERFCNEYPDVPVKILVFSLENEKTAFSKIPASLHGKVHYSPFIYDADEYAKAISEANITLGTSKVESFGISVFDSIKQGLVLLNLPCNVALSNVIGKETTFTEKEIVGVLYKVFKDRKYRQSILDYNMTKFEESLPSTQRFIETFGGRLNELMHNKLTATAGKSPKISTVMDLLDKGQVLTKKQVYASMGWGTGTNPLNSFWGTYYYGLRKHGAKTKKYKGTLYFYQGKFDRSNIVEDESEAPVVKNVKSSKAKPSTLSKSLFSSGR